MLESFIVRLMQLFQHDRLHNKMRQKLRNLNGWQRLWLIASVCIFVFYVLIWPLSSTQNQRWQEREYHSNVMREITSGKCDAYMNNRLETLIEPKHPYANHLSTPEINCYHLYNKRRFGKPNTALTAKIVQDMYNERRLTVLSWAFGLGLAIAAALSAALYFVGAVAAWVIRGFARSK